MLDIFGRSTHLYDRLADEVPVDARVHPTREPTPMFRRMHRLVVHTMTFHRAGKLLKGDAGAIMDPADIPPTAVKLERRRSARK